MRFQNFSLKYTCKEQEFEITSSDFSAHKNEHLELEFILEDINDDKRYKVILLPKQEIQLSEFFIETHLDYTASKGIFCNGFQ